MPHAATLRETGPEAAQRSVQVRKKYEMQQILIAGLLETLILFLKRT